MYETATGAAVTYLTAPKEARPAVALASHPRHNIASATADGQVGGLLGAPVDHASVLSSRAAGADHVTCSFGHLPLR